jgi:chromate reductase, NAD(P)H dehydrogenase (quinone)
VRQPLQIDPLYQEARAMPTGKEQPIRFLIFEASLRTGSLNDRLASLATSVIEQRGGAVDRAHLADFDCPTYDNDVEKSVGIPAGAELLRQRLDAAEAFVLASPEYNGSMPGGLKNVIDWVSRYRPQPFNGKQALLLSASPSMAGGNRGLWVLRIPLEHLGARVYPDMFSLAQAHQAFDDSGRIANTMLQQRFERTIECFMDLVEAAARYPALKKQWVEFLGERPDPATDRVETATIGGG